MDRTGRWLQRAFAGASVVWAGALPAATFAASRPQVPAAVYLLAAAVYAVGSVVCHQRPERSFFLWGRQLPVCARCTGIYVGAALAAFVSFILKSLGPAMADGSMAHGRRALLTVA